MTNATRGGRKSIALAIRAAAPQAPQIKAIAFTAPLHLQAAAPDGNGPKVPTFTMDAYTGGAMNLDGWQHPVVIDQDGWQDIQGSLPILRDHDFSQLVGHTAETKVVNGVLTASGSISAANQHSKEVADSAANGFPWQASVGANVIKNQFIPEGGTAQANGKTWQGPINIARRTSLSELSFVPLGADRNTAAKVAAKAAGVSAMNKFQKWAKAHGYKLDGMEAAAVTSLRASFKALNPNEDADAAADDAVLTDLLVEPAGAAAAAAATPTTAIVATGLNGQTIAAGAADGNAIILATRQAVAAETRRIGEVRRICAGQHAAIEAQAIEEGWDITRTELHVLRAARPAPGNGVVNAFGINTGAGAGQVTDGVIAASAAISAGVPEAAAYRGLSQQDSNIAASGRIQRATQSFYGICSLVAASNGLNLPDFRMTDEVVTEMVRLSARQSIRADGGVGFSTLSLPSIFQNVLNKKLLVGYGEIESAVPSMVYETSTNDFKPWVNVRLTMAGTLKPLGKDGEIKHVSLSDQNYTGGSDTIAAMIVFTRRMMMDDDLGALYSISSQLGEKAAVSRERLVFQLWQQMLTTTAPGASVGSTPYTFNFFSAGANNYITGVLGGDGMRQALQAMRQQKDPSGEPIMVTPTTLVVPPALEDAALKLYNSQYLIAIGQTNTSKTLPSDNIYKGRFKPVVSPYLGAASPLTGFTDSQWWLIGNPVAGNSPITINYVQNMRTPTIQRGDVSFDQLGMGLRVFWDLGVAANDFRTAVYSDGTGT